MFSRRVLLAFIMLVLSRSGEGQVFRSDDPLKIDNDTKRIAKPLRRKINDYYDFLENTFLKPGDRKSVRAVNVNTLGEVPDSSWFTNRIGTIPITPQSLTQAANRGTGPVGPLTIVEGKTQGVTPGFRVQDSKGEVYFIKFDPATNPEMATAAEMISSKFYYALGYNVAEYYIVNFNLEDLKISAEAKVTNELDEQKPLTRQFVEKLLSTIARNSDGSIRAMASKLIPGGIGPFKFYGTRADDGNDLFPHEHRRELRGYYIFCSWLNHDDSRSINTLDAYDEQGFVKHYLLDFGSTLGSGSVIAQKLRPGNEYMWEAGPTFGRLFSLGLWMPGWVSVRYPNYPSLGRIESEFFQPHKWKPEYPNAAFLNMDVEDAFWATRLLMMFTDDDIRLATSTGKLSNPEAEAYLSRILIERRNKIGNYWLRQVSSLDGFLVTDGSLLFEDLLVKYGFEQKRRSHKVSFSAFDNANGNRKDLGGSVETDSTTVSLPASLTTAPENSFFVVTLSANTHATDVFLKRTAGALRIVGVQRK